NDSSMMKFCDLRPNSPYWETERVLSRFRKATVIAVGYYPPSKPGEFLLSGNAEWEKDFLKSLSINRQPVEIESAGKKYRGRINYLYGKETASLFDENGGTEEFKVAEINKLRILSNEK